MKWTFGKKLATAFSAAALALSLAPAKPAQAQNAICLGQLMVFGGNFCPRGWTNADGQLLAISQNQALFSIFGTMYGGDGRSTFGVPDLRGRAVVHVGAGPGLQPTTVQGSKVGTDQFTILPANMPSHNHAAFAVRNAADNQNPTGDLLGVSQIYQNDTTTNRVELAATMIGNTGGGQSIIKRSPMQVIRYCVATEGVFCSRN